MIKSSLPPPEDIEPDRPPAIRAVLIEVMVMNLNSEFTSKLDQIIEEIKKGYCIDQQNAYLFALQTIERFLRPYSFYADSLNQKLSIKFDLAMDFEKRGMLEAAIVCYEELAKDAFLANMPYERMRIIYKKQHRPADAIRICQRYIEILELASSLKLPVSNIKMIPFYQEKVLKLQKIKEQTP